MIKKIAAIILFLVFCNASFSFADDVVKKYPPYPDIWGYEFASTDNSHIYSPPEIRTMPDGDYCITYTPRRYIITYKEETNINPSGWGVLHFFSGKLIKYPVGDENKLNSYINRYPKISHNIPDFIKFPSGNVVKQFSSGGSRCVDEYNNFHIEGKDKNGNVIFKKMLLYLYDKPIKTKVDKICERNNSIGNNVNHMMKGVANAYAEFVLLEDNTFLLYDQGGKYIIRFDEKFNTNSRLINDKLFIIDRKLYDNIYKELNSKNSNNDITINNELVKYLKNLRREKQK